MVIAVFRIDKKVFKVMLTRWRSTRLSNDRTCDVILGAQKIKLCVQIECQFGYIMMPI